METVGPVKDSESRQLVESRYPETCLKITPEFQPKTRNEAE